MATQEHSPAYRNAKALTVGLLCLAPVCALTSRLALGLVLLLGSGIGGAILWSCRAQPGRWRQALSWPNLRRALEGLLIASAIGLAGLACFLIAIPHFPGGVRPGGNESAAIATLRSLADAEAEFRAVYGRDRDGDGTTEFGTFAELAQGNEHLPPLLPHAFTNSLPLADGGDVVVRSGYLLRIYLQDGGESGWRCYAWPTMKNNTGKRAFFVDQNKTVMWTHNHRQRYSGTTSCPAVDAALPSDAGNARSVGRDGGVWQRL